MGWSPVILVGCSSHPRAEGLVSAVHGGPTFMEGHWPHDHLYGSDLHAVPYLYLNIGTLRGRMNLEGEARLPGDLTNA